MSSFLFAWQLELSLKNFGDFFLIPLHPVYTCLVGPKLVNFSSWIVVFFLFAWFKHLPKSDGIIHGSTVSVRTFFDLWKIRKSEVLDMGSRRMGIFGPLFSDYWDVKNKSQTRIPRNNGMVPESITAGWAFPLREAKKYYIISDKFWRIQAECVQNFLFFNELNKNVN